VLETTETVQQKFAPTDPRNKKQKEKKTNYTHLNFPLCKLEITENIARTK
jgi:hypothetical protein